jgi:hypothetical protein
VKQGGRGATGSRSKHRLRNVLVIAELAFALASLAGAAFFVRGIQRIGRADPGWQPVNLVNGSFVLPWSTYANEEQTIAGVNRLRSALSELPGVDKVAVSGQLPFYGSFSHQGRFVLEGQPLPPQGQEPLAYSERVTPRYFTTIGMHLLEGRDFSEADRADSAHVAIINAAMAAKFWPAGDAIGHRIGGTNPKDPDWKQIVGIVNDIPTLGGVATAGLPEAARRVVARFDPDLAVYQLGTADSMMEKFSANFFLIEHLLMIAAGFGLLLALVGIYGVIANLAVQRTQEIGVRMALGAGTGDVLWLVLRDGVRLAVIGTAIGLVLAFGLTRALSAAIQGVYGQDLVVMLGLAAMLVIATLVASWVPAIRATHVNPVEALRAE